MDKGTGVAACEQVPQFDRYRANFDGASALRWCGLCIKNRKSHFLRKTVRYIRKQRPHSLSGAGSRAATPIL